jgi:hypothetical protein
MYHCWKEKKGTHCCRVILADRMMVSAVTTDRFAVESLPMM